MINYELNLTKNWSESHISDYSCINYRQYLFLLLEKIVGDVDIQETCRRYLNEEISYLNQLFQLFDDHESLFIYRRFVLLKLTETSPADQVEAIKRDEEKFVNTQTQNCYRNSLSRGWQLELLSRHLVWLNRLFKWTFNEN